MENQINRRKLIGGILAGASTAVAGCGSNDSNTNANSGGGSQGQPVEKLELNNIARSFRQTWHDAANEAAKQVEELGFTIETNELDFNTWVDEYLNNTFKLPYSGMGSTPERLDPSVPLTNYFHSDFAKEGAWNTSRYQNPEYDSLVQKVNTTFDTEERKEYVDKAQEMLAQDVPMVMTVYASYLGAYRNDKFSGWNPGVGTKPLSSLVNLRNLEPDTDDGTVVHGAVEKPNTVNPMEVSDSMSRRFMPFVFDTLSEITPAGNVQPLAAESLDVADETTLTVTLRDGMTFHDGKPVRPRDFQFTIEYFKEWGQPYFEANYSQIESVELVDDNSMKLNLAEPDASMKTKLSLLPIMPEHVWSGVVEEEGLDHPRQWTDWEPVGSGPFTVNQLDLPNRGDWGVHENYQHDIGIDRYVLQSFGGLSQAIGGLEGGEITYVETINPTQYERLEDSDNSSITALQQPTHEWFGLGLLTTEPPFDDVTVRRAVAHTIDQERIVALAYGGYGLPGVSGTPISPANEFWHNSDIKRYDGGVEKGKELLEEAGYSWDDDGNLMYPADK
jgi:peptide/nickel transport system substrate-binding protein